MDASLRHWLSVLRKSLTAIAQGCYEVYQINPGSNIPQKSSCADTNHPSGDHPN